MQAEDQPNCSLLSCKVSVWGFILFYVVENNGKCESSSAVDFDW